MNTRILNKHYVVIMDASDTLVNLAIYDWVERLIDNDGHIDRRYVLDPISGRRQLVYELKTTDEAFNAIKFNVEDYYPGLCVFDPPM